MVYLTDDSAFVSRRSSADPPSIAIGRERRRARSNLAEDAHPEKVLRITTDTQLNALCQEDLTRLLGPSLRLKPRKAMHPCISVVF